MMFRIVYTKSSCNLLSQRDINRIYYLQVAYPILNVITITTVQVRRYHLVSSYLYTGTMQHHHIPLILAHQLMGVSVSQNLSSQLLINFLYAFFRKVLRPQTPKIEKGF